MKFTYLEVGRVGDATVTLLLLCGRHGLDVPHPVGLLGPGARRAGRPPPAARRQQELPLAAEEVLHQLGLPPHVRPDVAGGPRVGGHRRPDEVVVGGDHLRRAEAAAAVAARRVVPAERRRRRRQKGRERDARARPGRIAGEGNLICDQYSCEFTRENKVYWLFVFP